MISYIHVFEFVELWQRCKTEIGENVYGSNPTIRATESLKKVMDGGIILGKQHEIYQYRN